MYDDFELPVEYNGQLLLLPAQLVQTGYTHSFRIEIQGQDVLFERDEEENYRALVKPEDMDEHYSQELLGAVAEAIKNVLR